MDVTTLRKESRIPLTMPEFPTLIFQVILKPRNIYQTEMNGSSFGIQHVKYTASHYSGIQNSRFLQFRNTNVDVLVFN